MATDFDRNPNPTEIEMRTEWQGEEGLVQADFSPLGDGVQVSIETIHGRTSMSLDDLRMLYHRGEAYMRALDAARERDKVPMVKLRERA